MTIDVTTDKLIHIRDVCKRFGGTGGKRRSLSTVIRWILHGVKIGKLPGIRLEAVKCGGAWYTTEEAVKAFAASLTRTEFASASVAPNGATKGRKLIRAATKKNKRNRERAKALGY